LAEIWGENYCACCARVEPRASERRNAIAERVVRTLRNECLDHLIVVNEAHMHALLTEYAASSNAERGHRSPGLTPPRPTHHAPSSHGPVRARPVLGGLHHTYERAA